jgi:hypothetical protein
MYLIYSTGILIYHSVSVATNQLWHELFVWQRRVWQRLVSQPSRGEVSGSEWRGSEVVGQRCRVRVFKSLQGAVAMSSSCQVRHRSFVFCPFIVEGPMEVGGGRVRGGELNMELGSRPHHTSISPPTAACGTYPRRSPNVLGKYHVTRAFLPLLVKCGEKTSIGTHFWARRSLRTRYEHDNIHAVVYPRSDVVGCGRKPSRSFGQRRVMLEGVGVSTRPSHSFGECRIVVGHRAESGGGA